MPDKLKILIVEDDSTSAYILYLYLNTFGYEICAKAESGEEAITVARKERPDIVIMDINLEGAMNGIETVKKMREMNHNLSIIFATGNTDPGIVELAMSLNPASFITKPVNPMILKKVLKEIDDCYRAAFRHGPSCTFT